ncbi:MAG: hypothetical protein PUD20_06165 [bacterium]|nr:hypothetical protein [bacterium]
MEDMIALQGILLNGEKLDSPEKAQEFNTALQKLIEIGGSALDCLLDERFLKKQESPEFIEAMFRYSSVLDQPKYQYASKNFYYVLYRLYQNGCIFFDKNSTKERLYMKKAGALGVEAVALEYSLEVISERADTEEILKAISYIERTFIQDRELVSSFSINRTAEAICHVYGEKLPPQEHLDFLRMVCEYYSEQNRQEEIIQIIAIYGEYLYEINREKALSYLEYAREKGNVRANNFMNRIRYQGTDTHRSTDRADHPATRSDEYQKPREAAKKGPYRPIIGGIAHLIAGFMLPLWLVSLTMRTMEIRLLIFGLISMAVFAMHLRHAIHSGKYEETTLYGAAIGCRYWCIAGMAIPCAFGLDTGSFFTKIIVMIWIVGFVFAYFIKSKACFGRIYKFFMDEKR